MLVLYGSPEALFVLEEKILTGGVQDLDNDEQGEEGVDSENSEESASESGESESENPELSVEKELPEDTKKSSANDDS